MAWAWVLLLVEKKKSVLLYAFEYAHSCLQKKNLLNISESSLALWRTVLSNSLRSDGLIVFSSAEDRGALMRVFNNPSVVQ